MSYQSINEIQTAFVRLAKLEQQQTAKEAKHRHKIQALSDKHAADIAPLVNEQAAIRAAIADYAYHHRAELTDNGKTKTAKIGGGVIKWRKQPPKVEVSVDLADIFSALKRRRLSRFIRVKEELDKTAILKEAAAIKTPIHGLSITDGGETLSIEVRA